jgi:hypothetical protein
MFKVELEKFNEYKAQKLVEFKAAKKAEKKSRQNQKRKDLANSNLFEDQKLVKNDDDPTVNVTNPFQCLDTLKSLEEPKQFHSKDVENNDDMIDKPADPFNHFEDAEKAETNETFTPKNSPPRKHHNPLPPENSENVENFLITAENVRDVFKEVFGQYEWSSYYQGNK